MPETTQWAYAESVLAEAWFGPVATCEEAIAKAAELAPETGGAIADVSWPSAEAIASRVADLDSTLELMDEYAQNDGFFVPDDEGLFEIKPGAEEALERAFVTWARRYLRPRSFTTVNPRPVREAAHG